MIDRHLPPLDKQGRGLGDALWFAAKCAAVLLALIFLAAVV